MMRPSLLSLCLLALASCSALGIGQPKSPIYGGRSVDHLIQEGENHFAHLWMLSDGGENAEAYWSFDGTRLAFQARNKDEGIDCDRIYVTNKNPNALRRQVSNGKGTTTCSYFLPDGDHVVYASTHAQHETCPEKPQAREYVWPIWPQFDIYITNLKGGGDKAIVVNPGYDAEATVSPVGDKMVFTSTRSGDLELYTCDLDGSNVFQVTDEPGYDGGAFFSHSGEWLVFRTTAFDADKRDEQLAHYRKLLSQWIVKPGRMEIMIIRPDGTERTQVTNLGGANFAPFFFPDDSKILFSSNHHSPYVPGKNINFDLFAITPDGKDLERITTYEKFDSFPMFSPDGRYLVFSSNRGNSNPGDTNIFIAEWK